MDTSAEENFMGEFCSYEKAKVVILPVPLEKTSTYKTGSAWGPATILAASQFVELYDIELKQDIYRIGIHSLPIMQFDSIWGIEKSLALVKEEVAKILNDGKFPVVIGGEHTISYASFLACAQRYPDISVLHIDAHADLRDSYEDNRLSHACVLRRIRDHVPRTVSVGVRSLSFEEAEYIAKEKVIIYYDANIQKEGMPMLKILENLSEKVYITLDFDALNPAEMPSVGTPEPGGLSWYQLLELLRSVFSKKEVVGFDAVELKPDDVNFHADFAASKMIYKMIGYKFFLH